jgi:hypothetical protein
MDDFDLHHRNNHARGDDSSNIPADPAAPPRFEVLG